MLHLMILPSLLATILFNYLPLYGIVIAFKRYDVFTGILASPWASSGGLEHFIDFFKAPNFSVVLRNTLVISVLKLGLLSLPPVLLALMLNEVILPGLKKTMQTVSYLPHFISWVVVGGMMYNFLRPTPLNDKLYFGPVWLFAERLTLCNYEIIFGTGRLLSAFLMSVSRIVADLSRRDGRRGHRLRAVSALGLHPGRDAELQNRRGGRRRLRRRRPRRSVGHPSGRQRHPLPEPG